MAAHPPSWGPILNDLALQDYIPQIAALDIEVADAAAMLEVDVSEFNTMCSSLGMTQGHRMKLKAALTRLQVKVVSDQAAEQKVKFTPADRATCTEETRKFDSQYAQRVDVLLNRQRKPLTVAIDELHAAVGAPVSAKVGQTLQETREAWEAEGKLERADLISHPDLMDLMLALYMNTLEEEFPFYKVWRQKTQWTPDRSVKTGCSNFDAAICWMNWVDQALALIREMDPTTGYRAVKNWTYTDFLERFQVGGVICWYEPKSVAVNSPGQREGEELARSWAAESPDSCTVFIIENFTGHNISWLSHYPEEHEAMTRALTQFEVLAREKGDPSSADALMRADRVTLRQLGKPKRREPLISYNLTVDDIKEFQANEELMKNVDLFSRVFEIRFKEKREISKEDMIQVLAKDPKMDALNEYPCGSQGLSVMEHLKTDLDEDKVTYGFSLLAYNEGVNGKYDLLICHASQAAQQAKSQVKAVTAAEAAQLKSVVRDEQKGWFWHHILTERTFDAWYGVEEKSMTRACAAVGQRVTIQRKIAFQKVLAGYILDAAMKSKKLVFDDPNTNKFRLLPPP